MKIGNILACIGIILGVLGFICLPLYNFFDLSFGRGTGWAVLMQTGIFAKLGFILLASGVTLSLIAILLPKKYRKTEEDMILDEIKRENKKKKQNGNAL